LKPGCGPAPITFSNPFRHFTTPIPPDLQRQKHSTQSKHASRLKGNSPVCHQLFVTKEPGSVATADMELCS